MHLTRRIKIQLAVFTVIAVLGIAITAFGWMGLPNMLFGVGHYTVKLELPEAAGLYPRANVTYRGTEVGRVKDVRLTNSGVEADLSLKSGIHIPSELKAEVHSQTAVGEQFVALLPQNTTSAPLRDGDVIAVDKTSVPPDINTLLDATNRGLQAIPHDNLRTVIDESATAVGGLGPELSRIVKGSTKLAADARANLDALTTLVDQSPAVLDTQADTADSITAWAASLAAITGQVRDHDDALAGILTQGPAALDQVRQLFERAQPSLPILLANMVSLGQVGLTYQANIEQLLVLVPQGTQNQQGIGVANRNSKQDYKGIYNNFNLNLNIPPPCTTGFLPPQQMRAPSSEDYPDRPAGDLYCRVPQDSPFNVRGVRNAPCETVPGKRAPTVKLCESSEDYVPLNDGFNWKGDPNATLSGQDIPQLPPGSAPPQAVPPQSPPTADLPPPLAFAEYDPATGRYIGPDGNVSTQANLVPTPAGGNSWQQMLIPPGAK